MSSPAAADGRYDRLAVATPLPTMRLRTSGSLSPSHLHGSLWEIQLLGGFRVRNGDIVIDHFPTRAVVELLAALLLGPARSHSREELAQRLWPTADLAAGRNRLRNALSTLKAMFDRSGGADTGVIVSDRYTVRLNVDAVVCDVTVFEAHVRHGRHADVRACYRGELLPGVNAEWVHEERLRLAALYERLTAEAPAASHRGAHHGNGHATVHSTWIDGSRRRLPSYLTVLLGRERDIEALAEAVTAHRLVTVTGMGGCGKTRLCVETARRLRRFESTCLVMLEACGDAGLIADHVRAALGLQAGAKAMLQQIIASLEGEPTLLVLDGFEQLVGEAAAATLLTLLERLPLLHVLVSSQAALGIAGEHEYRLAPLPLPEVGVAARAAILNPSVALFLSRARAVRADFNIHARNVAAVIAWCRAAEGLPLAIELAASRVRGGSLSEAAGATSADWSALRRNGSNGAAAARRDSLVMAIEWSLNLLRANERAFLASISVFRGDWTEADACAVTRMDAAPCRGQIAALVRVSLLQARSGEDGGTRFHLPRHVSDVIAARLDADERAALRARHRGFFLARAVALHGQRRLIDDIDAPNFVEALSTAVADRDGPTAVALAMAMGRYWNACGLSEEAAGLLRRIVARPDSAPADAMSHFFGLVARLFVEAGHAAEARGLANRAVRLAMSDTAKADALLARVNVLWRVDRDSGPLHGDATTALALARAGAGPDGANPDLLARALLQLGALTALPGQGAAASALFEEAQAVYRRHGDAAGALAALPGLAICLNLQDRDNEAVALVQAGLEQARSLRSVNLQMLLFNRLGYSFERLRRFKPALEVYARQAQAAREHGMVYHLAYGIWNQCAPLVRLRRYPHAAMLMAFSKRYWVEHFGPMKASDLADLRAVREAVIARTSRAEWRRHWAAGWALSLPQALALAAEPPAPAPRKP